MPYGGIRMVESALKAYDFKMPSGLKTIFGSRGYRKTHNDGVFDCYTAEIRKARHTGIITGLPDSYCRGRIIGDYRRVALYGVDRLIADKQVQKDSLGGMEMDEDVIRMREELSEQIRSLEELKEMAKGYGLDISHAAESAAEAVQWLYCAYLGAVKEQNGAAMSLGRTSTFLDIYFERDLQAGHISESQAQEIIDQFIIKLRLVRFLRTPEYNQLFSGDPTWITEVLGGMGEDGRHRVTKTSYRFLQSLSNLGPAPEPNLTVLWAEKLPQNFKKFCSEVSVKTSAIQYENDDLMRPHYGDDYGIACCVSAMKIGQQMQFFGARVNLAKALLYAINGGREEKTGEQVGVACDAITSDILQYNDVISNYSIMLEWLAKTYINALNIIHYMHDKYCYERLQMALHDRDVERFMACGIAGLSVAVDSLSAIKYAQVKVLRNQSGLAVDYSVTGDFPKFGNNDDRVDSIAVWLVEYFMTKVRSCKTYRNSIPTQSVLTITSNVVYGKMTGATPDGRKAGEPFAPGANPMHGRDSTGPVASMFSVAKLPYKHARDGISYTFSIIPEALGKNETERALILARLLDGYFGGGGHHININVMNRDTLMDAMEHPEKYSNLTIRVSGYAVRFTKLTREQQMDIVYRTFHGSSDSISASMPAECTC
jgi:formate C-acetyltransferase